MPASALQGRRVILTRPDSAPLAQQLQAQGALPILLPTLQLQKLPTQHVVVSTHTMAIFASASAVECFLEDYPARELALLPCLAAVGQKTAAALRAHGLTVHLVPTEERASGLLALLPSDLAGQRILLPRSAQGRPELVKGLRARNAELTLLSLYETVPMISAEEPPPEADAICFASPSAVDGFFQKFPKAAASFLNSCTVVAIGPTTAAYVLQRGVSSVTVASTPSAEGFLAALAEVFEARL